MHEYSITESIINIACEELKNINYTKINSINIVIGKLNGFSPECIKFYFEFLSKDTEVENAELKFTLKNIKLFCPECKKEFETDEILFICHFCNNTKNLSILSGKEFYIDDMEVQE